MFSFIVCATLNKCMFNELFVVRKLKFSLHTRFFNDSIYALSSGFGKCGVAVIRLSGPKTQVALKKLTKKNKLPPPRIALLSNLYDNDIHLDKALVLWFPKPNSFTGEDVCELHVHGGTAVISSVFKMVGAVKGFRPAEPGDYTKRAFLNGKLDLTEVEGLGDLIHAETEAQRRQALHQMEGSLSTIYNNWKETLMEGLSHIEAFIDFGEDQHIEENLVKDVTKNITVLLKEIVTHLNDKRRGERLRKGVHMAIIGEPNVGKSSLLNEISQRPAAIVSEVPGTTRDIVETSLDIAGYPVVISDTAGIRNTYDLVEIEGVKRAKNKAKDADIILLMCDGTNISNFTNNISNTLTAIDKPLLPDNTLLNEHDIIILVNKSDLLNKDQHDKIQKDLLKMNLNAHIISCKNGDGIRNFLANIEEILKKLCEGNVGLSSPSLTQERYRHHLNICVENLEIFFKYIENDIVIAAEYLRFAMNELGKITGKVGAEDILDVIFKDFCIGK